MMAIAPSPYRAVPSENLFATHHALALDWTPALFIWKGWVQLVWLNSFPSHGPPHEAFTARDPSATCAGRIVVRKPGTGPQSD